MEQDGVLTDLLGETDFLPILDSLEKWKPISWGC